MRFVVILSVVVALFTWVPVATVWPSLWRSLASSAKSAEAVVWLQASTVVFFALSLLAGGMVGLALDVVEAVFGARTPNMDHPIVGVWIMVGFWVAYSWIMVWPAVLVGVLASRPEPHQAGSTMLFGLIVVPVAALFISFPVMFAAELYSQLR